MKLKDSLLCILVFCIWSTSSSLVSKFIPNTNPLIVSAIIVTLSLIFLTIVLWFGNKLQEIYNRYSVRELLRLILPSILGIYLYPILYFIGIDGASPIKSNVINYLWPLIAFIAVTVLNKKKLIRTEIIAIFLASCGGFIILCFPSNSLITFSMKDSSAVFSAFFGAVSYGIYTAIIDRFTPTDKNGIPMPAIQRIYVMMCIAFFFHCISFTVTKIVNPQSIEDTFTVIVNSKISTLSLLFYSILNFSIAHFLWNKINTAENVLLTSSMAFLIPFASTIVLATTTNKSIGFTPTIGLLLIIGAILLNNIKHINSINATFAGSTLIILLIGITPHTIPVSAQKTACYFLEIIIALYSIYYGFLLNRISNDYKEFEKTIHLIILKLDNVNYIQAYNEILKTIIYKVRIHKDSSETKYKLIDAPIRIKSTTSNKKADFAELYTKLCRFANYNLSLSEWCVIIILATTIIILSFFVKTNDVISFISIWIIGTSVILCVATLFEFEQKKKQLFNEFLIYCSEKQYELQ